MRKRPHDPAEKVKHMIPDIGVMIAAYIITRMIQMIGLPRERTKVFATLTIVVTVICTFDLLVRGTPTGLR